MHSVSPEKGSYLTSYIDPENVYPDGTPIIIPITPDDYAARLDEIDEEISKHVKGKPLVHYSAYKLDEYGLPINNLHEKAIDGKAVVRLRHSGGGKDWESEVMHDPTWLDLTIVANQVIRLTRDYRHVYFECFSVSESDDGIQRLSLFMGS